MVSEERNRERELEKNIRMQEINHANIYTKQASNQNPRLKSTETKVNVELLNRYLQAFSETVEMQQERDAGTTSYNQEMASDVFTDIDNSTTFSSREGVSPIHADDMLTVPGKMSLFFSYHVTTNGTFEGAGMNTAQALYVPMAVFAANSALKMMSKGSYKRYMDSNAFQKVRQELVFDSEGATHALNSLLRENGLGDDDIEVILEQINDRSFVPGRDADDIIRKLQCMVNRDTNILFTRQELEPLKQKLFAIINQYTPNVEGINPRILTEIKNKKDLNEQVRMINNYLRKHKLTGTHNSGLGNLSAITSVMQLKKLLKRSDLQPLEAAVINHALHLQAAAKTNRMSKQKLGVVHEVYRKSKQTLAQTHTGAGLGLMIDIIKTSLKTIKYGIHTAIAGGKGLKYGIRIVLPPFRSIAHFTDKQLMKIPIVNNVVTNYINPVMNPIKDYGRELSKSVEKHKQNSQRARQKRADRRSNLQRDTRKFIRDPFRVKEAIRNRRKHPMTTQKRRTRVVKSTGRVVHFIGDILAKMVSLISGAYKTVMSMMSGLLLIVGILTLIIMIVQYMLSSVMNIFTLESDKEDGQIINKCIEEINDLYEAQMDYINSLYEKDRYRNVTVKFSDKKNDNLYQLHDIKGNSGDLSVYTNSREILAMTKVRFGYDLESAAESEVLNYIRQLFNGSHIFSITETVVYEVNDNGEHVATGQYDATVIYTTYYFDSLFDCQLSNNSFIGIAGSSNYECVGSDNAEKIWNYFMQAGFTKEGAAGIMGNIMHESYPSFEPASLEIAAERKSGISSAEYTKMVDSGLITRAEVISSSRFGLYSGGRYGYGLCQFTYPTIKEYLCMCTIDIGKSIGDLYGQLDSLICYLEDYDWELLHYMRNADDPQEAANKFLRDYEKPSNIDTAEVKRRASAQKIYDTFYNYEYMPTNGKE